MIFLFIVYFEKKLCTVYTFRIKLNVLAVKCLVTIFEFFDHEYSSNSVTILKWLNLLLHILLNITQSLDSFGMLQMLIEFF
jgi:hypothetical protein